MQLSHSVTDKFCCFFAAAVPAIEGLTKHLGNRILNACASMIALTPRCATVRFPAVATLLDSGDN
jgi:hypothetical protein